MKRLLVPFGSKLVDYLSRIEYFAAFEAKYNNGPIFLETILIPVQAQRVSILSFHFFFKDDKAHNEHDKDVHYQNSITKPHTIS